MTRVAIIDNGGANIASLRYALERLGAERAPDRRPGRAARRAAGDPAGRRRRGRGHAAARDARPRRDDPRPAAARARHLPRHAAAVRGRARKATRAASGSCPAGRSDFADRDGYPGAAHGMEPARVRRARSAARRALLAATMSTSSTATPCPSGHGPSPLRTTAAHSRPSSATATSWGHSSTPSVPRATGARLLANFLETRVMQLIPAIDLRGGRVRAAAAGPVRRRDRLRGRPDGRPRELCRPGRTARARRGPRRCTRGLAGEFARRSPGSRPRDAPSCRWAEAFAIVTR